VDSCPSAFSAEKPVLASTLAAVQSRRQLGLRERLEQRFELRTQAQFVTLLFQHLPRDHVPEAYPAGTRCQRHPQ
jgi:hypothetical protein